MNNHSNKKNNNNNNNNNSNNKKKKLEKNANDDHNFLLQFKCLANERFDTFAFLKRDIDIF